MKKKPVQRFQRTSWRNHSTEPTPTPPKAYRQARISRVLAGAHKRERAKTSPWQWGCLEPLVSFPANCFRTSSPNSPENSCLGELNSWFYIKCIGWKNEFLLAKLIELRSQQVAHTYHIVSYYWNGLFEWLFEMVFTKIKYQKSTF